MQDWLTRHTILLLALAASASVRAEPFPERTLGRWETDIARCNAADEDQFSTGSRLTIANDGSSGSSLQHLSYEAGEALVCTSPDVDPAGTGILVRHNCNTEAFEDPRSFRLDLSVDGNLLVLRDTPGELDGERFHRCGATAAQRCEGEAQTRWVGRPNDRDVVVGYRPPGSGPTSGNFIFEGYQNKILRWRVSADYGCSNGISICSATVPMTGIEDISGAVHEIQDGDKPLFLALPELANSVARAQIYDSSEPTVDAEWFVPKPLNDQNAMILLPMDMKANGCVGP